MFDPQSAFICARPCPIPPDQPARPECPGTGPSWTPLFLTAGGLVMEVGGMMIHGAVVAREYGILAIVGVHEATRRLQTGQSIRIDGLSGVITLETEAHP